MIEVKNLTKTFSSGEGTITPVNDVSFELDRSKLVAIIGKSGSGKTTLLSLLGALEKPTSGQLEVEGDKINKLSSSALTIYRRKHIGFVFQAYNLIPNLSALDNVLLPMELTHVSKQDRIERAKLLLKQVGLSDQRIKRLPSRLSGGEQQRVAIARALANKPSVLLADEPTGSLDSETSRQIVDLLKSLAQSETTTVIIVTHDPAIAKQANKILQMKDGKII